MQTKRKQNRKKNATKIINTYGSWVILYVFISFKKADRRYLLQNQTWNNWRIVASPKIIPQK